jgi:hypothetical protein
VAKRRLPVITRPTKRSECVNGIRPCPWVRCKANMIIDQTEGGGIVINSGLDDEERGEGAGRIWRPTVRTNRAEKAAEDAEFAAQAEAALDWWIYRTDRARRMGSVMPDSCLEDILDRYKGEEMLLEDVGAKMFITRERARQIEEKALRDLEAAKDLLRRKLYVGQRVWRPGQR